MKQGVSSTANTKLDKELLNKIKNKGFSRIPIYTDDNDHIIRILYAKNLIDVNYDDGKCVGELSVNSLLRVSDMIKLDKLLNIFITENFSVPGATQPMNSRSVPSRRTLT